jgi:DNA-binding LacI/PurR family transcriptional regulator
VEGKFNSGLRNGARDKSHMRGRISPPCRITARDVAAFAGVSASAVSRTFTKGASVSPAIRNKVVDAARRLGYRPNLLARSLTTKRTELIGLIFNNFENPLFLEIFDHFTRGLQQRGLRPLLANLTEGEPSDGALNMLLQYSVDGVIVASSTLHRNLLKACAEARLPAVQAFGRPAARTGANVVAADNVQGGRVAADLFCERGYRRVAFLGGPMEATSTEDRLEGFRERLLEEGLRPAAEVYGDSFSYAAARTLMRQLIQSGGIDGVFCGDDILAIGAIDACRDFGISAPADIGIVGFDDMPMAAWRAYNLTTVRQPVADIIGTAIELIVSIVDQPERPAASRLFACEAVVRGTLRPASRERNPSACGHAVLPAIKKPARLGRQTWPR